MGSLAPGIKLIYERVGDTIYARREGEIERTIVGYKYQKDPLDHRNYMSDPIGSQLWHDIRQAALNDKELHDALERVKIIYYLKHKDNTDKHNTLDW